MRIKCCKFHRFRLQEILKMENIILSLTFIYLSLSNYLTGLGYIRLLLLIVSLIFYSKPLLFLSLYGISVLFDGFDGFLARKFNQTSAFGAWFDVVIDLVSRGALWCLLSKWGYFVIVVEWLTFVATHSRGPDWKIPDEDFPTICKMVMAKGFKTPLGLAAMSGLFVLPIWLYCLQTGFLSMYLGISDWAQWLGLLFLASGRILALTAELFFIQQHIKHLLFQVKK